MCWITSERTVIEAEQPRQASIARHDILRGGLGDLGGALILVVEAWGALR